MTDVPASFESHAAGCEARRRRLARSHDALHGTAVAALAMARHHRFADLVARRCE